MKTLVVGSNGSMGRRYCAILRYLKEDFLEADVGDLWWEWEFDRAILATPTENHIHDINLAITGGKPILCEKPIAKSAAEVAEIADWSIRACVDVRMVSNWKFAINLALTREKQTANMGEMEIEYNYYDSGKDGFFWDTIQLLFLAGKFKYDRTSPVFDAKVNGVNVTLEHIHASYVLMISEWLHGDKNKLWSLEDAVSATQKVKDAMRRDPDPITGEVGFK